MRGAPVDLFAGVMPFVATVEARSLTGAARSLGVTPSAVSKAIAKLESELGVRLLNRTARAVALTEEGTLFYRECLHAVAGVRNARDAVAHAQTAPTGVLRVSLPLALGELVVMPALPRLLGRHPGLSIETILTDRYVDLVAERFDAVVRIGASSPASGLKRHALPPVRWSTVASPSYLARRGTPRQPEDLANHNCLHFALPRGTTQPWQFTRGGDAAGGALVRVAVTGNLISDHPGGLMQATLAGLGISQSHRYAVATAIAEGRLVEILTEFTPPLLPMAILFPAGRATSPNIRAFIGAIAELLAAGADPPSSGKRAPSGRG